MLLRVSSNQQLEPDGDLSVQREIVKDYVKNTKNGNSIQRNTLREVTADIKIQSQTEMYFKTPYRTHRQKNMIFWWHTKTIELADLCGKSEPM